MSKVIYYGYSAFVIQVDSTKIVIDPGVSEEGESLIPASEWEGVDLVAVTHGDSDHAKMAPHIAEHSHATIIAHEELEPELAKPVYTFQPIKQGEEIFLQDVRFKALPATHGPTKGPSLIGLPSLFGRGEPFGKGNLSYLIEAKDRLFLHLGDTLLRGDWEEWEPDVLMLPIGGTVTLDPDEAVQAVNIIKPRITIPMHYNIKAGQFKLARINAESFKDILDNQGFDCRILSPGEFIAV